MTKSTNPRSSQNCPYRTGEGEGEFVFYLPFFLFLPHLWVLHDKTAPVTWRENCRTSTDFGAAIYALGNGRFAATAMYHSARSPPWRAPIGPICVTRNTVAEDTAVACGWRGAGWSARRGARRAVTRAIEKRFTNAVPFQSLLSSFGPFPAAVGRRKWWEGGGACSSGRRDFQIGSATGTPGPGPEQTLGGTVDSGCLASTHVRPNVQGEGGCVSSTPCPGNALLLVSRFFRRWLLWRRIQCTFRALDYSLFKPFNRKMVLNYEGTIRQC